MESLLASEEALSGFLESPVVPPPEGEEADPRIGSRVAPYRLTRLLGRGGMGAVYLGRRDDGLFDKRVAVKVVRRGMGTRDVVRRFERERRIVAAIEHPGIVRLLDGGATEEGLPYFVMPVRHCSKQ